MTTPTKIICGDRRLDLTDAKVMGILNVTPDSFSDGGQFHQREAALQQAARILEEGADIVDIGGESTRPGATPVTEQQELDRVMPVLEMVRDEFDAMISVDTSSAKVITEAAAAGAHIINDVRALEREGAMQAAVASRLPVCLMHMRGNPETMQKQPQYDSVVDEVYDYLDRRMQACVSAGIDPGRILLDPGFGFGKSLEHNLALLNNLDKFQRLNAPLLVGMSRKTMIGEILNRSVDQRMYGSIAAAVASVMNGAKIVRVHDVAPTVDAIGVINALLKEKREEEQA